MFSLDPVFNMLSSAPLAEDKYGARSMVSELITVLALAPKNGLGRALRAPEDFHLLQIADGYSFIDWLNDPEVSREEKGLFSSLATKMPALKDVAELIEERAEITEVHFGADQCSNFLTAYLLDVPLVSLNHDKWSSAILETKVQFLDDEGELVVTERDQINLSHEDHYTIHEDWIDGRRKRNVESMAVLWEKREEIFPNLIFCGSVEDQLLPISPGEDLFAHVVDRLFDLERVAQATPFDRNAFQSQCNPTTSTTLDQFGSHYSFGAPDGEKVTCGWHLYLPNGQRIYFSIGQHFTIGHIGEHLPTTRFPN